MWWIYDNANIMVNPKFEGPTTSDAHTLTFIRVMVIRVIGLLGLCRSFYTSLLYIQIYMYICNLYLPCTEGKMLNVTLPIAFVTPNFDASLIGKPAARSIGDATPLQVLR